MTTFFNNIKFIIFTWLITTLSAVICKQDPITLNCTIIYPPNPNETTTKSIRTPAINSCPKSYKNESIIERCEQLINRELPFDTNLFDPITNNVTKVTYWNKYCATCNNDNETKWEIWLPWSYYGNNEDSCEDLLPRGQRSEIDDLPDLLKTFVSRGVKLKSRFLGNRQLECSTEGNWPIHLIRNSLSCLLDNFRIGQSIRLIPCQYAEKSGKMCTRMRLFLDGFSFWFENNEEIYYNETLSEYKFTNNQYTVETSYDGVFYICETTAEIYGTGHGTKIIICIISLIFILAYFGINFNKRYFQNTADKMLYLYMVGLIVVGAIVLLVYLSYPVPCVAFYLAKFLWFHHFLWTLLIFIEYCSKYHCKCDDCSKSGDNGSSRRKNIAFYIYSVLGLVIPIALPITYYYGVLVIDENYKEDISKISPLITQLTEYTCPVVPDHSGISCTPYRDSGAKSYLHSVEDFILPSFSFLIPALFVFLSAFGVNHFTKICSSNDNEGPVDPIKRGHMIILIKMALIMGIHWILYKVYEKYGNNYSARIFGLSLDTICQFSIDFHGVIVFIVFGIGNLVDKFGHGFKSVPQQEDNQMEAVQKSHPLSGQ